MNSFHLTKNFKDLKSTNSDFKSVNSNDPSSVWLRTCEQDIIVPQNGEIKGHIPDWLKGSLIRNGPGSLKAGNEDFQHLFDCSAHLQRFGIKNGRVTYQSRFLQSDTYKKICSAKRIIITDFGTKTVDDPCRSIFSKISCIFNKEESDNSLVSVYPIGDEVYAFAEGPVIHRIDSDTLETEGKLDVRNYISIVHHSSHPHVEKDGTVYNVGLSISLLKGPSHIIAEFPKSPDGSSQTMFENARIAGSIPARWKFHPSYMHTFGITDKYFILVEQPLCIAVPEMVKARINNDTILSTFKWYPEEKTKISVISRSTGKLYKSYLTDSFCYFHIINQYESENHIVLDICKYTDSTILEGLYIESLKAGIHNTDYADMFDSQPTRFVLPLHPEPKTGENKNLVELKDTKAEAYYMPNGEIFLKPEKLGDAACEMPRINYENYCGKPYRYIYGLTVDEAITDKRCILKIDTETKSTTKWEENNCYCSEPVFVPSPNSKDEDDGVILSLLVWGGKLTNQVGLLVLDAKTMTELGRAEFQTPSPVPGSFHGWFLPKP